MTELKVKKTTTAYEIDGERFERVTNILDSIHDSGLESWRERIGIEAARTISKVATRIGDRIHAMVASHLTEGKEPKSFECSEEESSWAAYKTWRKERTFPTEAVVDFKTSSKVSPKYWLQMAAYLRAIMEMKMAPGTYSEQLVYSRERMYAGTADLICTRQHYVGMQLIVVWLDKYLGNYEQVVCPYGNTYLIATFLKLLDIHRYCNWTQDDLNGDSEYRRINSEAAN